jgi:hypothetical protein
MRESIQDIITRLLRYQRAPTKMTEEFKIWTHNKDILPKLQHQLEMILDAYGKFQPVVYDTQGILDDGSDLILRHREVTTANTEFELLSFQVKSYNDLCKKTYMQELKAQHDDTFRKVIGLQHYFLFLCTDESVHKDRLRNIAAEFRSATRTEIIEPAFAHTFLNHPRSRVDAIVKRTLQAADAVFKSALESIEFSSPSVRGLAIFIAVQFSVHGSDSFDQRVLLTNQSLRSVYDELRLRQERLVEDFYARLEKRSTRSKRKRWDDEDEEPPMRIANFEEQLGLDLAVLENVLVDFEPASDTIRVRADAVMPLTAVIVDAVVRYDYDASTVLAYMFNVMGVLD